MQNLLKVKSVFENIAKETLEVEYIGGTYYAFGSELATLRLFKGYKFSKGIDAGYSTNLGKFYFRLETTT